MRLDGIKKPTVVGLGLSAFLLAPQSTNVDGFPLSGHGVSKIAASKSIRYHNNCHVGQQQLQQNSLHHYQLPPQTFVLQREHIPIQTRLSSQSSSDDIIDAIVEDKTAGLELNDGENTSAKERSKERKRDVFKKALGNLASLSLIDYKWRSALFKKNEADRMEEEWMSAMMGEDPSYARPMDAGDERRGPLGNAEKSAVQWLQSVIEEEGKRARRIAESNGELIRPKDLSPKDEAGPLSELERRAIQFLSEITDSEVDRVRGGTMRPKDMETRGPLGEAEARAVVALDKIVESEKLRMDQSRIRGGEVVRPIDIPATIGLANQTEDPTRILGWVSYCGIESFGSVMVSLFWSFANSSFNLKQAKRSYGVMVATAQVGSILGPTFVNKFGTSLGIPTCYMVGASCMGGLQFTMWVYVKMFGVLEEEKEAEKEVEKKEDPKKKNKAGILEGIHLFMEHNYVKGIFAISCLFMVEVTIVDYTMKVLARDHFSTEYPCTPFDDITGEAMSCWNAETNSAVGMSSAATESFTAFMGLFGQATNTLSFLMSFFGTSAVIRYLGLRTSLVLFPSLCLIVIIVVRMYPTLNVVFATMMILKATSYALNNPTKEMLYQPTSSNVKYKAKSWIDIFGARGSKALGSVVTNAFSSSAVELVDKGSIVGMCVASFLIWNARFMGKKFEEYTESGYVVGGNNDDDEDKYLEVEESENEGMSKNVEMASRQNTTDTSCGFYGDDELGAEEEGQSESDAGDEEEDNMVGVKSPDEKHVVQLV